MTLITSVRFSKKKFWYKCDFIKTSNEYFFSSWQNMKIESQINFKNLTDVLKLAIFDRKAIFKAILTF